MFRPKDEQERVLHRLKIARGHLNKVISMVEKNEYCINVLHQSKAIGKALQEIEMLILENHLNTCVVDQIKKGEAKTSVDEIMKVFRGKNR